jgi:transcription factor SPT20
MAVYNDLAVVDGILGRHALAPASFSVNLYGEHWTLGLSQSKFLYNNPVAVSSRFVRPPVPSLTSFQSLLDDIRAQRIPTDFIEIFESAGLKFYEGARLVAFS